MSASRPTISIASSIPRTLYTPRLKLELYDGSVAHDSALIAMFNDATTLERMGDFGVRDRSSLAKLLHSGRVRAAVSSRNDEDGDDEDHHDGEPPRLSFDLVSYWLIRPLRQQQQQQQLSGNDDDDGDKGGGGGPLVGGVSLEQRVRATPPDIGWCVLGAHQGRGYATEAAREVLRCVTEDLRLRDVLAWPGAENRQSRSVARKIGLVEGGVVKDESGEPALVYMLPGMTFNPDMILSHEGDAESEMV